MIFLGAIGPSHGKTVGVSTDVRAVDEDAVLEIKRVLHADKYTQTLGEKHSKWPRLG